MSTTAQPPLSDLASTGGVATVREMPITKVLLVANARAGEGRAHELLEGAQSLEARFDCERLVAGDGATERIRDAASDGQTCVVVFGGDGTVNRILPDLVEKGLPLVIFPGGSVNDLAREVGMIPDWHHVADRIASGRSRSIDLIEVGGSLFATYGSLGLGAVTSKQAILTRRILAPLRRAFPLLLAPLNTAAVILFSNEYIREFDIDTGTESFRIRTSGIYVANQGTLNGKIQFSTTSSNHDGIFEVYIMKQVRRLPLLSMVANLQRSGTLEAVKHDMCTLSTDRFRVSSVDGKPFAVFGDGEMMIEDCVVEFRIRPQLLKVCGND